MGGGGGGAAASGWHWHWHWSSAAGWASHDSGERTDTRAPARPLAMQHGACSLAGWALRQRAASAPPCWRHAPQKQTALLLEAQRARSLISYHPYVCGLVCACVCVCVAGVQGEVARQAQLYRAVQRQRRQLHDKEFSALQEAGSNPYEVFRRRELEAEVRGVCVCVGGALATY